MSELRNMLLRHPRGVTVHEVAAQLQVTPRSARRYLDALSSDIESVAEDHGRKRWRIPAADMPRRIHLRKNQAYALLAATPIFRSIEGSALFEEIALAEESLVALARRPGRGPNAGALGPDLESRFCYAPFAATTYEQQTADIDQLFRAVTELIAVACKRVVGQGDQLEESVLFCCALLFYKESWICIAQVASTGAMLTVPVHQLTDVRCLDEQRFELPAGFDTAEWIQGQFGIWPSVSPDGAPATEVVVDFDLAASDYLYTRPIHRTKVLTDSPNGGIRLILRLSNTEEVVSWLLGFGSLAQVVRPIAIRQAVVAELRRALDGYSEG